MCSYGLLLFFFSLFTFSLYLYNHTHTHRNIGIGDSLLHERTDKRNLSNIILTLYCGKPLYYCKGSLYPTREDFRSGQTDVKLSLPSQAAPDILPVVLKQRNFKASELRRSALQSPNCLIGCLQMQRLSRESASGSLIGGEGEHGGLFPTRKWRSAR